MFYICHEKNIAVVSFRLIHGRQEKKSELNYATVYALENIASARAPDNAM